MKRFSFAQILTMLSLVAILASCGFTQPGYGEDYGDRPVRNRSVYMDPYYGNSQIVRDPYTGRYYEVTPVGPYGYDPYSSYGTYGNGGYYGRNTTRVYRNNNPRTSNTPRVTQSPQVQQPRESSPAINKAKSVIRKD